MNAHSDDFDMADDFRDLSQAYRDATGHEDDQEPSPVLDAAILAAAHRAVASRPQAVPARQPLLRLTRWRVPLAMAASILIGVLITVLFIPEETGPGTQILAQAPEAAQMEEWSQAEPPPPARMNELAARGSSVAAKPAPESARPEVADMYIREKSARATVAPSRKAPDRASEPPDAAKERQAPVAAAPLLAKSEYKDDLLAQRAGAFDRNAGRDETPVPAAQEKSVEQAPQTLPMEELPQPSQDSPPEPAGMAQVPEPESIAPVAEAAPAPEPLRFAAADMPAMKLAQPEAADKPATQEEEAKRQNPQAWLEEIEKLRRDGKIKEARESLTEFRKRYPNHELPKTLRNL